MSILINRDELVAKLIDMKRSTDNNYVYRTADEVIRFIADMEEHKKPDEDDGK